MSQGLKVGFTGADAPLDGTLVLLVDAALQMGAAAAKRHAALAPLIARAAKAAGFKGKAQTALALAPPAGMGCDWLLVVGMGEAKSSAKGKDKDKDKDKDHGKGHGKGRD